MPMESHSLVGGKVQVYRRENSRFWQCAASVGGKQRRASTKEESLVLAKQFAEDWYLELRGKDRAGLLTSEKTFRQAADQFVKEYAIITEGHRSPRWVEGHGIRLRLHRDVAIVKDDATGERILEIEVRGKRGVGYCKSMPSAVRPYERLLNRPKPGQPKAGGNGRECLHSRDGECAASRSRENSEPFCSVTHAAETMQ
jgi:hypothetical protein